jgi:hypothetical protein
MRKLFYLCHLKTKTYTGNFTFSINNLWFSGQVFELFFQFFWELLWYTRIGALFIFRIVIMNTKNHLDNHHQGSIRFLIYAQHWLLHTWSIINSFSKVSNTQGLWTFLVDGGFCVLHKHDLRSPYHSCCRFVSVQFLRPEWQGRWNKKESLLMVWRPTCGNGMSKMLWYYSPIQLLLVQIKTCVHFLCIAHHSTQ